MKRDPETVRIVNEARKSLSPEGVGMLNRTYAAFPNADPVGLVVLLAAAGVYYSSGGYMRDGRGKDRPIPPKVKTPPLDDGEAWLETGVTDD